MLFKKITNYIIPVFTASLVVSYFACYGYYSRFAIDITSYIGVYDLTIIFAKYVWLAVIGLTMVIYLPYAYFNRPSKRTRWDRTIGKSMIKRRVFLIFPTLIIVIVAAVLYHSVLTVIEAAYFVGLFLLLLIAAVLTVIAAFSEKKEITEVPARDWITILGISTLFIFFIPFLVGYAVAPYIQQGAVSVKFENKEAFTTNNANDIYVGKTSDYFFVYHPKTKTSTVYRMDKVESVEVIPAK